MGAQSIKGMWGQFTSGWLCWMAALRAIEENPLAQVLIRIRQRGDRGKGQFDRRQRYWVPRLLVGGLVLLIPLALFLRFSFDLHKYRATFMVELALGLLAVIYLLFSLLPTIFRTVRGVLDTVSPVIGKQPLGLVKDLFAISVLTDREVVAGVVRAYLLPLARVVFFGVALVVCGFTAWDAVYEPEAPELHALIPQLALVLLSVLTMTLSGSLAGMLKVLVLIVFGAGLRTRDYNWFIAICWTLVHLLYLIGAGVFLRWYFMDWLLFIDEDYSALHTVGWTALYLLVVTGLAVFFLYQLELRRAVARITPFALPVIFFISCVVTSALAQINFDYSNANRLAAQVGSIYSWGVFPLINPLAVPVTGQCLCALTWNQFCIATVIWPQFFLVLAGQFALIAIAANFARRAIQRLRTGHD